MPVLNRNMKLIVIRKSRNLSHANDANLLRFATCSKLLAGITFSCLNADSYPQSDNNIIAIPQDWAARTAEAKSNIMYYKESLSVPWGLINRLKANSWLVISNGRFVTRVNHRRLGVILTNRLAVLQKNCKWMSHFDADVIAVNVDPALLSYREKVRITSDGNVAGFRRLYFDSAMSVPIPTDWPHHIFVKIAVLEKILDDGTLPLTFAEFVNRCTGSSLSCRCIRIGGTVLDLQTEAGLLGLLTAKLHSIHQHFKQINHTPMHRHTISTTARLFGKVVLGNDVHIGDRAVIVGPTIISDNVKIGNRAVIRTSIIGPGLSVPKGRSVQNRVLVGPRLPHKFCSRRSNIGVRRLDSLNLPFLMNGLKNNNFRTWPRFSYARCAKRVADIIASSVVLVLFAPVLPVIALAIKLSSPGPVFFKDRRQGLHGREFFCLKFRTMIIGADKIQERLRFKNQVDGPQFKIKDDPRIAAVGKFLRDTFIDEIPQFFNILLGQMSVVGPRPSPEMENSFCPFWRDARLSVRPGITGLWQVCRTRQQGRDFQEWIYYDTKYVRNLSLSLDLWTCWQTAKKLINNFIEQC